MTTKISAFRAGALIAGVAAVALTGAAFAQGQSRNAAATPSFARAAERVESKGFTILEMDRDRGGFDVEAMTSDGRRVELDVAADGAITRERPDH